MARKAANGNQGIVADESDEPVTITSDGEVIPLGDDIGIPTVNPTDLAPAPETNGEKRGRGRPRGSKNTPGGKQATKEVASDLTGLLMSAHIMLASLTKVDEFVLDKEEAERLAAAIAKVNAEYGGMVLPPKAAAWIHLAMAGGSIYGPRLFAYKLRMKNEAMENKQPEQRPQVIM